MKNIGKTGKGVVMEMPDSLSGEFGKMKGQCAVRAK
jgi:hypothetical protein